MNLAIQSDSNMPQSVLIQFNKVPESQDSRLFSSLPAFSKNTTSSAKAIPCMQASTPSLSIGGESLALLNNAQEHRLWYLDSIAIMSPAASLGGRGSSAVERETPGEEDPGSIPAAAARSLLVGSVSV